MPSAALAPGPAVEAMQQALPSILHTGATDRLARAHDASHYLLTPAAVAVPRTAQDIGDLLHNATQHATPLAFRSGGTSLSGQASTDGILVDVRTHFRGITVIDEGALVRAQPGATVRAVNTRLARHGRKLGPDPASEIAATIGGVIANNSSGMACGIERNSYRTLDSLVLVLADGTLLDTSRPDADDLLRRTSPAIHDGLLALRQRIMENPESLASIRRQYAIKNTMGYGLNSLVDFESPIDMLAHLMVGSEGTLGFIAEATFRTVPLLPHCATALLVFTNMADALTALPGLVDCGFVTIELLDSTSLRVAQRDPQATAELRTLDVHSQVALLVEHQQADAAALAERIEASADLLRALPFREHARLTTDAEVRARLWNIRKGLYTAVAGSRRPGTTALLEDIAVPADRLLDTCTSLSELLEAHGYSDSVIFGHAKDGNLHFMINEEFHRHDCIERYEAFTENMVDLVLGSGGTLKAEHGTGRIMAPFLERQYGVELVDVMRSAKRLLDPRGLLNRGVLLTDDPRAHLKNFKAAEPIEEEVDLCVECGYCEPACPSADLTLTPRQRIALRRDIAAARSEGDLALAAELERDYAYQGIDTCAVDGLCGMSCPLHIDTADLVRHLRADAAKPLVQGAWKLAAQHWDTTTTGVSAALVVASRVPPLARLATDAMRRLAGDDVVPSWTPDLPRGGAVRRPITAPDAAAVFFSSCTSSMFGSAVGGGGVSSALLTLCARTGVHLRIPDDIGNLCCGVPWKSKGLNDGHAVMRGRMRTSLLHATDGGRLPIVCDASSCTEGLRVLLDVAAVDSRFNVIDATEFVAESVLQELPAVKRLPSLAVHLTCSSTQLGANHALLAIANHIADRVFVPDDMGCCAFAGDRGMLHPELTASATRREAAEVRAADTTAHASSNRTCEIGMSRATGKPYRHILELLEEAVAEGAPLESQN